MKKIFKKKKCKHVHEIGPDGVPLDGSSCMKCGKTAADEAYEYTMNKRRT